MTAIYNISFITPIIKLFARQSNFCFSIVVHGKQKTECINTINNKRNKKERKTTTETSPTKQAHKKFANVSTKTYSDTHIFFLLYVRCCTIASTS